MTVHFKLNVYISVLVEKLYDSYLPPLLYLGVFAELKSIHTPIMVKTYQQERHLLPQASVGPKSSVPKKSRSGHSRWQHFCCKWWVQFRWWLPFCRSKSSEQSQSVYCIDILMPLCKSLIRSYLYFMEMFGVFHPHLNIAMYISVYMCHLSPGLHDLGSQTWIVKQLPVANTKAVCVTSLSIPHILIN